MRNFLTRSFFVLVMLVAMFQVSVNAQQPRVRFNLPSGGFQEVCLEQAAAAVDVEDDTDILITADAASDDLGCPGSDPIINSLNATPAVLDLMTLNCDLNDDMVDDAVCLFVNWNITPALTATTCDIEQVEPVTKFSQTPFEFTNPSSFVDPDNPTIFASVVNGLEWPVNMATVTAGLKRFRMTCTAAGGGAPVIGFFESTYIDGADPTVTIDTFNIVEATAEVGSIINFNWNVTLSNSPSAPTCTLSSPGTINPVTVAVTAAPGNATATILNNSPTGARNFTFSCRPDAGSGVTDTANDTVTVQAMMPPTCNNPIVPSRDTSFTTYQQPYGSVWPGPSGDNVNIQVDTGSYMALQFTAQASQFGQLSSIAPAVGNFSAWVLSIDPCPGEYSMSECRSGPAVKNNLNWHASNVPLTFGCELEIGQTYFVNIFVGNLNGTNNCSFSNCVIRMNNGHDSTQ